MGMNEREGKKVYTMVIPTGMNAIKQEESLGRNEKVFHMWRTLGLIHREDKIGKVVVCEAIKNASRS